MQKLILQVYVNYSELVLLILLGTSVFKNIYEIKPAHFAVVNQSGVHFEKYWELKSHPHTDNFNQTCEKVKYLLDDAIQRQLVSDVPLCLMLSRWIRFKYYNSIC